MLTLHHLCSVLPGSRSHAALSWLSQCPQKCSREYLHGITTHMTQILSLPQTERLHDAVIQINGCNKCVVTLPLQAGSVGKCASA